jgi:hypothetical protein
MSGAEFKELSTVTRTTEVMELMKPVLVEMIMDDDFEEDGFTLWSRTMKMKKQPSSMSLPWEIPR